jgi:hypothetical protein
VRWIIRTIVSAAAFIATIVVLLDSSNVWQRSETDWHPGKHQVISAVVILALSALYGFGDAQLERLRARRRDGISVVVGEFLFPLWCRISGRRPSRYSRTVPSCAGCIASEFSGGGGAWSGCAS